MVRTLSLRLPDSLHKHLRRLAAQEGIFINQFIATAVAEKMSALTMEEYLATRVKRGKRSKYEAVLANVADRAPDPEEQT